jgi:hypothetical protein
MNRVTSIARPALRALTLLAAAGLTMASPNALAGDPDYLNAALKRAHGLGFTGCDGAIKETFALVGGESFRLETSWFDDAKKNHLKFTVVFGKPSDSILMEVTYLKLKNTCYSTQTIVMTMNKTCVEYAAEMPAFAYAYQAADYTRYKNSGNVPMLLRSVNGGCVATFQVDRKS